jgi:DNA-binding XRE family transcriptional regulator
MQIRGVPNRGRGEDFHGLLLRFRGRTALTQRQVATRIGASARSIQAWEAGVSYPGTNSLKALITCFVESDGFARGQEAAEAEALWLAVLYESPRHRPPFDTAWFADLVSRQPQAAEANQGSAPVAPPPALTGVRMTRLMDWGDAPDVLGFVGRVHEIEMITEWVLGDHSRVVALVGMGGIGKTTLAAPVARNVAPTFERVYWRSVRNAPPLAEWLAGAIGFLSDHRLLPPDSETARMELVLEQIQGQRCLLVLDNLEPVLLPGGQRGAYLEGYAGYGTLLRVLAQSEHQSCLIVTSRETPTELTELGGDRSVRTLEVGGLTVGNAQALLSDRHLRGEEAEWASLVGRYGGNGLALKVVAETVVQVFGGDIAAFLEQAGSGTFGGIRRLLDGQMERLSFLEQEVLASLGVEREPATFTQLVTDLGARSGRAALLEAVESLRRRSLIDRTEGGPAFTLQSVVLEYVTDRLLERSIDEIERGQFALLQGHALLKAQAKDYVRRSQERLLIAPLLERLIARYGSRDAVEQRIIALIDQLRALPHDDQRSGPGNLVNLLRVLRGDLRGLDLS